MRASGTHGELRVGYQVAARLGPWSMEQAAQVPVAYEFRALVLHENSFWITQRPLDLVVALGTVEWTWRDVSFERDGRHIVVELCIRPEVLERAPAAVMKGRKR
jgi:hypothetical protein